MKLEKKNIDLEKKNQVKKTLLTMQFFKNLRF